MDVSSTKPKSYSLSFIISRADSFSTWISPGAAARSAVVVSAVRKDETADGLADRALELFAELVAAYGQPDHGYTSRVRPIAESGRRFRGDYDHLARVQEWSLLESEDDYR